VIDRHFRDAQEAPWYRLLIAFQQMPKGSIGYLQYKFSP
jgi:hypothetical protein